VLPKNHGKESLDIAVNDLAGDSGAVLSALKNAKKSLIDFRVPRLNVDWNEDMGEYLKKLGVQAPFTGGDFGKMSNSTDVFIQKIKHAAGIRMDEDGVKVAAAQATVMGEKGESEPKKAHKLHINRPFFVMIIVEGMLIAIGKITDPGQH